MTLGDRLKALRRELGLSQEALGAQGFVSTPGWIKIENGQRQASEKLLDKLTRWLVEDRYMRAGAASALREELLTLKYLGSRSLFVREMAKTHAKPARWRRGAVGGGRARPLQGKAQARPSALAPEVGGSPRRGQGPAGLETQEFPGRVDRGGRRFTGPPVPEDA